MTTAPNAFGVSDQLGSGGTGLAPDGASGPSDGTKSLRDLLRGLLGSVWAPFASTAAMQASLAKNRSDGQLATRLSDHSLWEWNAGSSATADATHIAPTDVGAGAGRWEQLVAGTGGAVFEEATLVLTPAAIAALGASTTGVLNFAAALPANARIVGAEVDVTTGFTGGGVSALTAKLGDGTTVDKYMGAQSIFTAGNRGGGGTATYPGQSVAGVTPQVTLTSTTANLAGISAGAGTVKVFYFIQS